MSPVPRRIGAMRAARVGATMRGASQGIRQGIRLLRNPGMRSDPRAIHVDPTNPYNRAPERLSLARQARERGTRIQIEKQLKELIRFMEKLPETEYKRLVLDAIATGRARSGEELRMIIAERLLEQEAMQTAQQMGADAQQVAQELAQNPETRNQATERAGKIMEGFYRSLPNPRKKAFSEMFKNIYQLSKGWDPFD